MPASLRVLTACCALHTRRGDLAQASVKNCFIRGSVIRYVQVPKDAVDTELLQDAARKEAAAAQAKHA